MTTELPASAIAKLTGCWKLSASSRQLAERWTFRAKRRARTGSRSCARSQNETYAARARIPHDLMYDPAVGNFAFAAAGRIHGAMYIFVVKGDQLVADSYYSRVPGQYAPSFNTFTLVRC